jgi:hypothetical protein
MWYVDYLYREQRPNIDITILELSYCHPNTIATSYSLQFAVADTKTANSATRNFISPSNFDFGM